MSRDELISLLSAMPPIPNLLESVESAFGGPDAVTSLVGAYAVVGYETATVYLVTDRLFAMFEASADGRSYTLTCPLARLRRVGRFEDASYTRLVLEIDADRTVTRSVIREDGSAEGEILPAGYELLESDPAGRVRLRAFHVAIARVLGG